MKTNLADVLLPRNWALQTRVSLYTLATFVVSLWAVAFFVGQRLQTDMQQLLSEQQFASVSLVASQINSDVEDRLSALKTIAQSYTPALLMNATALQADLERRAVLTRQFNRGVFVTDLTGLAIASVPLSANRAGLNFLDKEHVAIALKEGRANVSGPTIGKTLGAPVIVMAVPIRDAQNNVIGAFMGATDLAAPSFLDKLADSRFGKTGGFLLVSPKHRLIITAGDKRRMMEFLPPLGQFPMIDRFISGYEGAGVFVNPLGVEVLAAAKAVPAAGWYIAVQLPVAEAFAPVERMKQHLQLAALLATLLVGLLTWWMVRREMRPLSAAVEMLSNFSENKLPVALLPTTRHGEVGKLLTGFNRLLETLVQRDQASKQAQELLEGVASRVPGVVYQFKLRADGTSCFPYASRGIREIYRVEPEEVREDAGKVFAILHPDDYDAVAASIQQSAEQLTLWRHEYRVKFVDGTVRWLQGNAMPQREDDGAVLWHGFITDITERKQAEVALRESERRVGDLLQNMPSVAVQGFSLDGKVQYWNAASERLYGYTASEALGRDLGELLLPKEGVAEYRAALKQMADSGQALPPMEMALVHKDGSPLQVYASHAIVNSPGQPVEFYCFDVDLTERKRMEREVQIQRDFATQILNAMGQGVSVTSPEGLIEFANPALATLLGYSPEEMIGMGRDEIFFQEDSSRQPQVLAERMAGKSSTYDARFGRRDGTTVQVQVTGVPRFLDGKYVGSIAVITDLTERKHIEQVLRDERDFASQVINAMGQGLSVTNEARLFEFVNPALAQMLGYEISELLGKHSAEVIFPQDKHAQDAQQSKRQDGVSSAYEVRLQRRDGALIPVQIFAVPRLLNGRYAGSIAVVTDLTEQKRAERVLQESEQRFRMLIELSPEASVVHSAGVVVYANPAALSLYGATDASQLLGRSIMDFVHADSREVVLARVRQMIEGATLLPVAEVKNIRLDGSVIDVESQSVATEFNGRPAVRLSIRDVTARNKAERERASLEAQLRESQKMQAIGTLAGGVAHDFNNILAAILGNTELASDDAKDNPGALESLEEIRKAAARARALVQQILSFGRRQPTERRPIILNHVVEESRRLLRATLPARLSLSVNCAENLPPVLADATQIQQAILNLATNALQAIPSGPGLIQVRVDVETLDQNLIATHPVLSALQQRHVERVVSLTVSDSGPGIPPDILDRIFEPFFTTKPVNEGTGLGLSVVHGIVEAHEGAIDVKSPPGHGATFTIFLPAVLPGAAFKPSASPRITGGNLAVKKASKANGLRVLFLDDDEAVLFLVSRLLERRGMQVTTIGNQQEALDLIRKDPKAFNVVVTDYNMPGMSGVDVARELREIRAELPVILVSGFVDDQVRETALAAGVKALVFKETIVEEFANAIISAAELL